MSDFKTIPVDEASMAKLAQLFEQTLSPNPAIQKPAENQIMELKTATGFIEVLVRVMTFDSISENVRLAASIYFKNYILNHWVLDENETDIISPSDRAIIKANLIKLMLITSGKIKAQVTNALVLVAKSDFPGKWPTLLDDLMQNVTSDIPSVVSALEILHYVFFHWRTEAHEEYFEAAKILHAKYVPAFISIYSNLLSALSSALNDPNTCSPTTNDLMNGLHFFFEMFISITSMDISDFIVSKMKDIVNPAIGLLAIPHEAPMIPIPHGLSSFALRTQSRPVDVMQTSVMAFLHHFAKKYADDFNDFAPSALNAVWQLFRSHTDGPRFDSLFVAGFSFLALLAQEVEFSKLFTPPILREICESLLVQMRFTTDDEEDFTCNGEDFVARNLLGSDRETRKRAASDLLSALALKHNELVSSQLSEVIAQMLKEYTAAPAAHWYSKEAALSVIIALCRQPSPLSPDGFIVVANPHIDIGSFLTLHVMPELADVDALIQGRKNPVLIAGCLRFLAVFASLFPIPSMPQVVSAARGFLRADEYVVHTYAALVIDAFLSLRAPKSPKADSVPTAGVAPGAFLYDSITLASEAPGLLRDLFAVLATKEESGQNGHVAKVILRVVVRSPAALIPIAGELVSIVGSRIALIATQPNRPIFTHAMFEVLACMISLLCSSASGADPSVARQFEVSLLPLLGPSLLDPTSPAADLIPYTLQILALILRRLPAPVSPGMAALFPALLAHERYSEASHTGPLVQMLCAFMSKGYLSQLPSEILNSILGIFQFLVSVPLHDAHGITLIRSFVKYAPASSVQAVLPTVLRVIFTRLRAKKTVKFNALLGTLFADLVLLPNDACGPAGFVEALNKVQPGLVEMVLMRVWPAALKDISVPQHKVLAVQGAAVFISYIFSSSFATESWGAMVGATCLVSLTCDLQGNCDVLKPRVGKKVIDERRLMLAQADRTSPEAKANDKVEAAMRVVQGSSVILVFAAEEEETNVDASTGIMILRGALSGSRAQLEHAYRLMEHDIEGQFAFTQVFA